MSFDPEMPAELAAELAAPNVRKLIDPRGIPVRFSRLRRMARSPLHYYASCQGADDDSLARRLGRGAHALVLGTPVVLWDAVTDAGRARPRNGAAWEAFKAEHASAEILNAKEFAQAKAITDAIRHHPIAAPMLEGGSLLEHEINWRHPLGRRCSSHLDIWRPGEFVADLKTCRDSAPDRFSRAAFGSAYHSQMAFYCDATAAIGHPTRAAYVIAVENEAPYAVTVLRLTDRALEAGRKQCHLWLEQLLACELAGSWPAYSQSIVDLDVPEFDTPFVLTVDGEDVQF